MTKNQLVALVGPGGLAVTIETDPPLVIAFPGSNSIEETELGPVIINLAGDRLGSLGAVMEDPNFAALASTQLSTSAASFTAEDNTDREVEDIVLKGTGSSPCGKNINKLLNEDAFAVYHQLTNSLAVVLKS